MKLATLRSGNNKRHGQLIVVSKTNSSAVKVGEPYKTLKDALENWADAKPKLQAIYEQLNAGKATGCFSLDLLQCMAPLPNAPGFYDGSAFLSHVVRARKARGDEMPASAKVTPLMYQGVSDNLLSWNSNIELGDPAFGGDFEGEFAVITTDVPKGTTAEKMDPYIVLLTLFNDITLREIVKVEIETKFGFLQSKPNSSFAPIVVTPDELGTFWKDGRYHADLEVKWNGELFGHPNGREMHFSFHQLVAHAARTRPLSAGSIVGCGTISNEDKSQGFACLTEKRFQEIMENGKPTTRWLNAGDQVQMDVTVDKQSVFGAIEQSVVL